MRRAFFALLCAVTLLAPGACSIQTAGAPKGDLKLQAVFDDVQGLVVGHSVQISDVRVGTVTSIKLDGFRARITMSIKNGRRIPEGTSATIARTSLLGENYVRLNIPAGRDLRTGPALAHGATITQTSIQPDLELVTERVGPLLAALGGQDLGALIDTGAEAFGGQGPKLNRLIKQAADISSRYAAARDDLGGMLDGLARLGNNLAAGADDLARRRRSRLTSATKSNGIVHTLPFWDELVRERAAGFADVRWDSEHIDALCAKLVLDPGRFDVIVGSNLFGDILSDLAAAVAGGIGIAPSANLNPAGEYPSMFEPVHGSAPDIAGRGIADPLGAIWSAALMLDHLGHPAAAATVTEAIAAVLARSDTRTPDLGGSATTAEFTEDLLRLLPGFR